ncbi:hypothetical protein BDR04DRAFT_1037888 [Suillus decipiens]|nr:hypothetical protein BDR04DRAFT_1037888 [Suillus decipiens]
MHNLKKAGVPHEHVNWYRRRLANRTTYLFFDDYQSNLFNVVDKIDQGCPPFPSGFVSYNSDVLRVADLNPRQSELSLGFLDDVALAARGKSY